MILNKKGSGELIVNGIGACAAAGDKKQTLIIIAYSTAENSSAVGFVATEVPKEGAYLTGEDFLTAIARAENVKTVRYVDDKNRPRDIFICREALGKVNDYVLRDEDENRYVGNFSEVCPVNVKFSIDGFNSKFKSNTKLTFSVQFGIRGEYDEDSCEYAVVNAYNACLLSVLFGKDIFALETRDGKRINVKIVKDIPHTYDTDVLYVSYALDPEGYVAYYVTEEFFRIDGEKRTRRQYNLKYFTRPYAGYHAEIVDGRGE